MSSCGKPIPIVLPMRSKQDTLRVNEIFYSIQGESSLAGRPCVFIRLTYCNLRCTYCDTSYAFFEGNDMSIGEIITKVKSFDTRLVEITGGEPLIQKKVHELIGVLCDEGFEVLIETGGHMDIGLVDDRVKRIIDIKCPSSGESGKVYWNNLGLLRQSDEVKFVIGDGNDYEWAKAVVAENRLSEKCTVLFSPVFDKMNYCELAERILNDQLPVRFQLQMHKFIWPPDMRGV